MVAGIYCLKKAKIMQNKIRFPFAAVAALAMAACASPSSPQVAWEKTINETAEGGFIVGNPQAKVKVVEYGSRTCKECANFAREGFPALKKEIRDGNLSFEFRDYLIHGTPDLVAAVVGTCGVKENRFSMLEAMFRDQETAIAGIAELPDSLFEKKVHAGTQWWDIAAVAGYRDIAKDAGLSDEEIMVCLASQKRGDKFVAMTKNADPSLVQGTPSFIVNGTRVEGKTWEDLHEAIEQAK